jgi:hypothetical protein
MLIATCLKKLKKQFKAFAINGYQELTQKNLKAFAVACEIIFVNLKNKILFLPKI